MDIWFEMINSTLKWDLSIQQGFYNQKWSNAQCDDIVTIILWIPRQETICHSFKYFTSYRLDVLDKELVFICLKSKNCYEQAVTPEQFGLR